MSLGLSPLVVPYGTCLFFFFGGGDRIDNDSAFLGDYTRPVGLTFLRGNCHFVGHAFPGDHSLAGDDGALVSGNTEHGHRVVGEDTTWAAATPDGAIFGVLHHLAFAQWIRVDSNRPP